MEGKERSLLAAYVDRLRAAYRDLEKSRLVEKHETDNDALRYFEARCNQVVPLNIEERSFSEMMRKLHKADPTSYTRLVTKTPHLMLLSDARSIVAHFGVQQFIYMDWVKETQRYNARENTDHPTAHRSRRGGRKERAKREAQGVGGRKTEDALRARLDQLEKMVGRFALYSPATEAPGPSPINQTGPLHDDGYKPGDSWFEDSMKQNV